MAQSYTTDDGITLFEPGTVVSTKVVANQGGFAASGVVTLIGEANEGPGWTEEEDLDSNAFGPDQINDITSKYGEGKLVDAFRGIISAAADPAIVGAVSLIKIIKTNNSTKASSAIARQGLGAYATLTARRAGAPGNLVKYRSQASQAEAAPTSGEWTYAPRLAGSSVFKIRNNGGTQKTVTVTALMDGPTLVAALEDTSLDFLATGGEQVSPLTGLAGIVLTASVPGAGLLALTLASGSIFADAPSVGDTVVIPLSAQYSAASNSIIAGGSSENVGCYVVTGVVNTVSTATITMKAMTITGPGPAFAAGAISAGELDILVFKPITFTNKTGKDRQVDLNLAPDWSTTSNDGTNAVVAITSGETWVGQPQVGDTVKYTSTFAGVTAGFYVVTSSTPTTVSFSRLSNGSAGTTGTALAQAAGFTVSRPSIDGLGKSLEVSGDATAIAKNSDGTSTTWSNSSIISAAEQQNTTTISRGTNSDAFISGGEIVLKLGCHNGLATVEISSTKMDFKENAVLVFSVVYAQVRSLRDIVDLVNSKTGYTASLGSNKFSTQPPSILDSGTYTINTDAALGLQTGRIKQDAQDWASKTGQSGLATPTLGAGKSGLPDDISPDQFLQNGAKGGTSSMAVSQAFDACSEIDTNFVVPLFSQDATQDAIDGETESSSTYVVDAINSLVRSHVIANSALKAKKNRIGFTSKIDTYAEQKEVAGAMSYFRVAFCIQDQKLVGGDGLVKTFQPWMSCVLAAGMQSAAGYRGIVKKFANTNGIIHRTGDFNARNRTQREDALRSGILFMEPVNTGGFRWVSDQTTHTVDNNFVFNSLQAVYLADLMALTLIDRFDRAVVGKSVAEISAAAALGLLESVMFDFRRLKWIAPSIDAPKGYKNASVKITGATMRIGIEAKLAGLIYFVPINFDISEVTQEAVG